MRIGLYGMPSAGKTSALKHLSFMECIEGSSYLRKLAPDFDTLNDSARADIRRSLAESLLAKDDFIMDGHYAFGSELAFTEADGNLYDVFIYLYVAPEIIKERMSKSDKNKRYFQYDVEAWQQAEIDGLRAYCHRNGKDFYVIDNPPHNDNEPVERIIAFIRTVRDGYSSRGFAERIVRWILHDCASDTVMLLDGDRTVTLEDTSNKAWGYRTNLFDGNFYTGYQAWRQAMELSQYSCAALKELHIRMNERVLANIRYPAYILTAGDGRIWSCLEKDLGIKAFYGSEMSADTKYFVTKELQKAGKRVIAYGDSMNDFYMLRQADKGFLVKRPGGAVSSSLKGQGLEGLIVV